MNAEEVAKFIEKWAVENEMSPESVTLGIEYWKDGTGRTLYLYDNVFRVVDKKQLVTL